MGRGQYKSKPTGQRQFSSHEDLQKTNSCGNSNSCGNFAKCVCASPYIVAGTSTRLRSFSKQETEYEKEPEEDSVSFEDGCEEDGCEKESDGQEEKRKYIEGLIEIENPNLVKPKTMKAKDIDIRKPTELSRREREELNKQQAHERYMTLQEQGKTEQARKDLEQLTLIRQHREEAVKKRQEAQNAKEQKKAESRN